MTTKAKIVAEHNGWRLFRDEKGRPGFLPPNNDCDVDPADCPVTELLAKEKLNETKEANNGS
jgi:hypothetical protein